MARYLVVGGFEPSGHDSIAEAFVESGIELGHEIELFRWRDYFDISRHLIFNTHRYAASKGVPDIAGMLDESWIAEALAEDLSKHVPKDFDGIISVHPWSSFICGNALSTRKDDYTRLIDYTGEFTFFPLILHNRIDAFVGGGPILPMEPLVRSRCHSIGVVVRKRFFSEEPYFERQKTLFVSAGSDGWAINAMIPQVKVLAEVLQAKKIILLGPNAGAADAWSKAKIPNAEVMSGIKDIAPLLKKARWYLSKGSGTAVAEGLAAGCYGFAAKSGIFWEDDAVAVLCAEGIVANPALCHMPPKLENSAGWLTERERCQLAANRTWELMDHGKFKVKNVPEQQILADLIKQISTHDSLHLPQTSKRLRERLLVWSAGWNNG